MKQRVQRIVSCLLLCALLTAMPPAFAAAATTSFSDVPAASWASDAINRAVSLGFVQGQTSTTFGVGHKMSRAAFTVALCRAFGWELETPETGSFTDNQDQTAWYYSAVETAFAHGVLTKQSETFRPNDAITRSELVVMLVRALGYTTLASVDVGLTCPFKDVEVSPEYLTLASYLGIASGTSDCCFSPDAGATREQAVVMLMRAYDQCQQKTPERIGITASANGTFSGCSAIGVSAAHFSYAKAQIQLRSTMTDEETETAKAEIENAGAKALLNVSGDVACLQGSASEMADDIAKAVNDGAWAGVLLDIPNQTTAQKTAYVSLVSALDEELGGKLLYVTAEAPVHSGAYYGAYDYAALAAKADRLIVRVAAASAKMVNNFPTAPLEPLEEVYYTMAALKNAGIRGEKISLWMTTTGSAWATGSAWTTGSTWAISSSAGDLSAEEIEALLASVRESAETYYSTRYASAYLVTTADGGKKIVWYNDANAAAARVQLCSFFGVHSVCLSDLTSVADYSDYSILKGLGESAK